MSRNRNIQFKEPAMFTLSVAYNFGFKVVVVNATSVVIHPLENGFMNNFLSQGLTSNPTAQGITSAKKPTPSTTKVKSLSEQLAEYERMASFVAREHFKNSKY